MASPLRIPRYFHLDRIPSAIPSLDGLRGIAILLVLLRHAVRPFYDVAAPGLPLGRYDVMTPMVNGWMGVDLFFVLSGFLVTHHLVKQAGRELTGARVREYLVKRFLRIVPAYYAVLFLVVAGLVPGYHVPTEGLDRQVAQHLLFLQDYYPSRIVVAFWSLGVEEKFYFAAPFLVLALMKVHSPERRVRWLLGLIAIPALMRSLTYALSPDELVSRYETCFWILRSPFHLAVDSLLVGSLCAFLVRDLEHFPRLQLPAVQTALMRGGSLVILLLLCGAPLLERIDWFDAALLFPLLAVGFGAILLSLVLRRDEHPGWLGARWLFFFSKLSYALYLTHMLFIDSLLAWLRSYGWFVELSRGGQFLVYFPLFTLVSIAASLLLHYAVEKPGLMLKDAVRVQERSAAAPVSAASA